jgi:glutamate 5-kinase
MSLAYKKVVIKIGSNVLTKTDGLLDEERIAHLSDQISALKKQRMEVILVSSGAVASGRGLVKLSEKTDPVAARQLLASIGQVKLINIYSELFRKYDLLSAQVLVTKEDFRDRLHYLNMRNCFTALLQNNIIPIVNENDVISVTELMFTDNDELAGLISSMMDVDALIILTNVDGIFNGPPNDPKSELIREVDHRMDFSSFVTTQKSNFGRGGMVTKGNIAQKAAKLGIAVHIANGKKDNILLDLIGNKPVGTRFKAKRNASNKKKWLAYSENNAKGVLQVNEGARVALTSDKAVSLLPIGVTKISGTFEKGDIIKILDEKGQVLGLGIAECGSEKALETLGAKNQKPLIHYDYLFLNQ